MVDALPALRVKSFGDSLFFDHCHLTEHGNAIVARLISDQLLKSSVGGRAQLQQRRARQQAVGDSEARSDKAEHFLPGGAALDGSESRQVFVRRDGGQKMPWTEPLHRRSAMGIECRATSRTAW
jgi:hypothetical protein